LSILIDESGDFGKFDSKDPNYHVVMVVHEQHYDYFADFDKIIVYYDYGQSELAKIIISVFNALFVNVEFRKALPTDYILLQVADLICTVQMISTKKTLSRSEEEFFHSRRDFNKNISKTILKKKL
jgi:hypothetical protein